MSSVIKLKLLGQSVWYDNVNRSLITDGTMRGMIERREIFGVTSNPSIFHEAITQTKDYDADLQTMSWSGLSAKEMFYRLAIQDIKDVADLFRPYYEASHGADGFVSLEVNPNLAFDTQGTIEEAKWLWKEVNRPNLMVKIPATKEGLPAITESIASGVNVNVTLIFSRKRYIEVMHAFIDGLEQRHDAGNDISQVASVASFFVSRLETKADQQLQHLIDQDVDDSTRAKTLKGRIAVANTRLAYQDYEQIFTSARFNKLSQAGGQKQRPLWASTSTKDPDYSDIKYVESLVADNSVNTIPPKTLIAYLDHGDPQITIHDDLAQAEKDFATLEELGISIDEITQELEDEGVEKFAESFNSLIDAIKTRQNKFLADLGQLATNVSAEVKAFENKDVVSRMFRNDPTVWTNSAEGQAIVQTRLGWLDLPSQSQAFIPSLIAFTEQCKADGFRKVLLLGMGGSSLAPETISLIFRDEIDGLSLKILDSTLPGQVRAVEDWVDYKQTLFIVASKSGTTTETLSLFQYFWEKSENELGDQCAAHFAAITDPGSSLAILGHQKGFRAVFTADPNVGGRYSVLTHFGLVPAALMGIDLEKLLSKAQGVASNCSPLSAINQNFGALLGIILGVGEKAGKDKLTFVTDKVISPMNAWLEQLIAESSGKEGRGIIPIADEPIYEVEQYAADRLFIYLRQVGEHDSFIERLEKDGQPVVVLDVPELYDLGGQFFLWEFAIAVACSVIGVNAFDQPDVQDSKNRTKKILADFAERGRLVESDVIWEAKGIKFYGKEFAGLSDCETVSQVIESFSSQSVAGDYVAINAYIPRNDDTRDDLQELRRDITNLTGCPTTLGFGPRFLHSTGQLHKGGANNGLFLQITQATAEDLAIPGALFTFGVLAHAQAQGDLEALLERDRRAIRIHLPPGASLNLIT